MWDIRKDSYSAYNYNNFTATNVMSIVGIVPKDPTV